MSHSRRNFLRRAALGSFAVPLLPAGAFLRDASPLLKPPRLKPGDTIGLVSPGGAIEAAVDVQFAEHTLSGLGLNTKRGHHVLDRRGYLGGTDADRAADLNRMFADPDVDAIVAMRGGWGSARILPLLDYDLIRRHPKILVGFSDITSLLLAIYARSGVVTFHGPVGISSWNDFTVGYLSRVLFEAEPVLMAAPAHACCTLAPADDRVSTITPGQARGRLVGGNLSVISSIIGSEYLPDWSGHILFLEETREEPYRIDRMMAQLKLAGVLEQISGFIFGQCTRCDPEEGYESLTLEEVLNDYVAPLGIPAWRGASIGHVADKFTIPLGVEAEIDASAGTIRLLESAVS